MGSEQAATYKKAGDIDQGFCDKNEEAPKKTFIETRAK